MSDPIPDTRYEDEHGNIFVNEKLVYSTAPAPPRELSAENHCKDCCCAQSWKALGITEYNGLSIPENIAALTAKLEEAKSE